MLGFIVLFGFTGMSCVLFFAPKSDFYLALAAFIMFVTVAVSIPFNPALNPHYPKKVETVDNRPCPPDQASLGEQK